MADINAKPTLAVDCSTQTASIALAVSGAVHARAIAPGRQAAELVPQIDALLKEYGVAYSQLGHLLTTLGPGSFTGLRIALATVHGLALAHAIPVKAVTSLMSMAWDVSAAPAAPPRFHAVLNAGKGEVFVQEFAQREGVPQAVGDIALVKPDLMAIYAECFGNVEPATPCEPRAETLCRIAPRLPELPLADILPLYIRPPDAIPGKPPPWLAV